MLARVHTHTHACAQNQMALRALRAFRLRKALAFVRYIADTARTTRRIYMRCQAKPTHGIHYVQAHTFRRCMHHGTRDVSIPRLLYYTYSITYRRRANSQQQPAADRVYVVCKYCTRAREWQCVCVYVAESVAWIWDELTNKTLVNWFQINAAAHISPACVWLGVCMRACMCLCCTHIRDIIRCLRCLLF